MELKGGLCDLLSLYCVSNNVLRGREGRPLRWVVYRAPWGEQGGIEVDPFEEPTKGGEVEGRGPWAHGRPVPSRELGRLPTAEASLSLLLTYLLLTQ